MAEGALGEVLAVRGGRVIFRVEKRQPVDEAAFEKEKASLAERFAGFQSETAFRLWFEERRKAANLIAPAFEKTKTEAGS